MDKVKEIDLAKQKLEARFIPPLKKIFRNLAADAKTLYISTQRVPAESLALHYRPEFLKIARDAQRASIKEFGFNVRKDGEAKGYAFKTEKYKALINYQIETKDNEIILSDSAIDKVNNDFALEATYFVEEQSDIQADYITDTNEKEITNAEKLSVILFFTEQTKLEGEIRSAKDDLRQNEFNRLLGASPSISDAKKEKLEAEIRKLEVELEEFNKNKDKFIGDEIEDKLLAKSDSRSELIAEQNVGLAQSWAKATEEDLVVDNIEGATKEQNWRAILDSHTRYDHAVADGQKKINGFYVVGGHRCARPYDPSLPIEQTAGCRCQEETRIVFLTTNQQ